MGLASRANTRVLATRIGSVLVVMLAVRFLADVTLAAASLPSATLNLVSRFLEAYEIVLPFAILPVAFALARTLLGPPRRLLWLAVLGLHLASLAVWLGFLGGYGPQATAPAFLGMAVLAAISASALSLGAIREPRRLVERWRGMAYLGLLAIVPAVFTLRAAALSGFGTSPGEGGVLHGNWVVVNLPTLLLELFVIGIWLGVAMGATRHVLRRRWYAFLPFAALLLLLVAIQQRPLVGFIFSALVEWGTNLAVFVPPLTSLTLAIGAAACYFSTFLLLPRRGNEGGWDLLLLGTLAIVLSGFYLSMASVEGLAFGLVLVALSLSVWKPEPA